MDITLFRYLIVGANWAAEKVSDQFMKNIEKSIIAQKLVGEEPSLQYGLVNPFVFKDEWLFGLFIQKYPTTLTDYDESKQEKKVDAIDTGEYLFALNCKKYEVLLQARRNSNLPSQKEILFRFTGLLRKAFYDADYNFNSLKEFEEFVDAEKIKNIFYNVADRVTELELKDFDPLLIKEEKIKRNGQRQKYFNPREEYQEAMEEAILTSSEDLKKADLKAKEGKSLKKDPIARALLEGARKPMKIVYTKDNAVITEKGVIAKKEVISLEGESLNFNTDAEAIISKISGQNISKIRTNNNEPKLFQ